MFTILLIFSYLTNLDSSLAQLENVKKLEIPMKSQKFAVHAEHECLEGDQRTVSTEQFDRVYGDQLGEQPPLRAKALRQQLATEKGAAANKYRYNDTFVRHKFLPMAAAAYANDTAILSCLRNTFPGAELHHRLTVNWEGNDGELCAGFVALIHSEKAILLSFRGTGSNVQLCRETYQDFRKPAHGILLDGKVGSYYLQIYDHFQPSIAAVMELSRKYTDYEIWLTGHSFGGAMAALASAQIYSNKVVTPGNVKLLTMGQPRIGDDDWARAMDEALPFFNYRVVHAQDPVPHKPRIGYLHHSTEVQ